MTEGVKLSKSLSGEGFLALVVPSCGSSMVIQLHTKRDQSRPNIRNIGDKMSIDIPEIPNESEMAMRKTNHDVTSPIHANFPAMPMATHIGMKNCKLSDAINKTGISLWSSRVFQQLKREIRVVDIRMKLDVFQLL